MATVCVEEYVPEARLKLGFAAGGVRDTTVNWLEYGPVGNAGNTRLVAVNVLMPGTAADGIESVMANVPELSGTGWYSFTLPEASVQSRTTFAPGGKVVPETTV
jgi:hypothetical protein